MKLIKLIEQIVEEEISKKDEWEKHYKISPKLKAVIKNLLKSSEYYPQFTFSDGRISKGGISKNLETVGKGKYKQTGYIQQGSNILFPDDFDVVKIVDLKTKKVLYEE